MLVPRFQLTFIPLTCKSPSLYLLQAHVLQDLYSCRLCKRPSDFVQNGSFCAQQNRSWVFWGARVSPVPSAAVLCRACMPKHPRPSPKTLCASAAAARCFILSVREVIARSLKTQRSCFCVGRVWLSFPKPKLFLACLNHLCRDCKSCLIPV